MKAGGKIYINLIARLFLYFILIYIIFGLIFIPTSAAVKDCMLQYSFDSLDDWQVSGSITEIAENTLLLSSLSGSGTTAVTQAKFTIPQKYNFDWIYEFRMRVTKNTGTIIARVAVGSERSNINITNGGRTLTIPSGNNSATVTNISVNLPEVIKDYKPNDWHTWRIETVDNVQKIYIDGKVIFDNYTQFNWSQNFEMIFWANEGVNGTGNELYVDYCKFNEYKMDIPVSYGGSKKMFSLITDNVADSWTRIGDHANGQILLHNNMIGIKREGAEGSYVGVQREVSHADNMIMNFKLQIPHFSKENTVLLRNNKYRIQVMFFEDKIQYRNSSSGVTNVYTDIGTAEHSWTYVLQGNKAMVFMDGKCIAAFIPHRYSQSGTGTPCVQVVANNNINSAAEINISSITLEDIQGSVISTVTEYLGTVAEGERISISVNLHNVSTRSAPAVLVFAMYDSENKLLGIEFSSDQHEKQTEKKLDFTKTLPKNIKRVSVLMWKSLDTATPTNNGFKLEN